MDIISIEQKQRAIEDIVVEWSDTIANDIAERRFYNKSEVAAYAKVKLFTAITECIAVQVDELEKERVALKVKFNNPSTPSYIKMNIQARLTELKLQIKERNTFNEIVTKQAEFGALKNFVKNKLGVEALEDFFE